MHSTAMFRVCLLACSLIYGITAKPYKPWKIDDAAFQDTIMTKEEKIVSSEVIEPPQDKDVTDYDIDPGMTIGRDRQHLMAEVDTDQLNHPSMAEILKELQESSYLPKTEHDLSDIHSDKVALREPEQDVDELNQKAREELDMYLRPLAAKSNAEAAHVKPEEAKVHLYQADIVPAGGDIGAEDRVRLYVEPEEDHDDLYHAEQVHPADTPVQMGMKQLPIADWPSMRMYSQPEEDLDGVYHH